MQFQNPIPVSANGRKGLALYVKNSNTLNGDIWCISFQDGSIGYFTSDQVKTEINSAQEPKPLDYGLGYLMKTRQPI